MGTLQPRTGSHVELVQGFPSSTHTVPKCLSQFPNTPLGLQEFFEQASDVQEATWILSQLGKLPAGLQLFLVQPSEIHPEK
jgi:hypothetical protein